MNDAIAALDVDALAQEIRRVDGENKLGAGALAEALLPFIRSVSPAAALEEAARIAEGFINSTDYDLEPEAAIAENVAARLIAEGIRALIHSREDRMVVVSHKLDGTPDVWCDPEIADIVAALNKAGIRTVASCSGHGFRPGHIALQDGRELIIPRDAADSSVIENAFPLDINGNARPLSPKDTKL